MSVTIGFIRDGVLLGATAESLVAALDQLAEAYGDHVVPLFAQAQAALMEDIDGPHLDAPGSLAGALSGGDKSIAEIRSSSDDAAPTTGKEADEASGRPGADEPTDPPPPVEEAASAPSCGVCGASITADRYEISVEDYGEGRCKACSG